MPRQAKTLVIGAVFGISVGLLLGFGVLQWQADEPVAPRAQTPRAAIEVVTRVSDLLDAHGHEAFELLDRDPTLAHPDTYIFVLSADGTNIYHAGDSTQVGTNFVGPRDVDHRPFGLGFITDVAAAGVWSAYRWNNPATGHPEWKLTFTRQTKQGHIVGAGIYGGPD